jgi:glucose-1-phosphate thymidylyltransferase
MKGIILAGGSGTRLYPLTKSTSKQLLPIYDKPMIYYPLSVLMMAGIKDVLIISTPEDLPNFKRLLGSGSNLGISIQYKEQPSPDGLAQAFIIGEQFIGNDDVCLVLGDNIFHGRGFINLLSNTVKNVEKEKSATIFGYYVQDPERYGIVDFDNNGKAVSIEEKPIKPKSNHAVVGLYFYPNSVISIAKKVKPSNRGELEITSVNNVYLANQNLKVELMGRGFTWLDTGTPESLLEASNYIQLIESRQGLKIACIEEIAFEMGYISREQLLVLAKPLQKNKYGQYLINKVKNIN